MTAVPRVLRRLSAVPFVVALGGVLCRCGGAAPQEAPPAAAPASRDVPYEAPPAGGAPPRSVLPRPTEAPSSPPAPPSPPPPPRAPMVAPTDADRPADQRAARIAARAELDRAQRDLESAASDCASACRALASMERATSHLCSLAEEPDDQRRCEDARLRLAAARGRVRAVCGGCG